MTQTLAALIAVGFIHRRGAAQPPAGLVKNPRFTAHSADAKSPAHYTLTGDAAWAYCGWGNEASDWGVALHSGKVPASGVASAARALRGAVSQDVTGFDGGVGKWFRFSIRGLAEKNFAVADGGLFLKVDFFANKGQSPLDGVTRAIDSLVAHDRAELAANGDDKTRRRRGLANLHVRVPPAVRGDRSTSADGRPPRRLGDHARRNRRSSSRSFR